MIVATDDCSVASSTSAPANVLRKPPSLWTTLPRAAPALLVLVALRALGLLVVGFFAVHLHHKLIRWDGEWYALIARRGYGVIRLGRDGQPLSDYAFFPLYPSVERGLSAVSGMRYVDAGLVISAVASLVAALGIFAVGDVLYGRRVGLLLTMLWAALPMGFVLSMAYSEALFTALAAWALYAVLTTRWILAGLLAGLAGFTRPTGIAVAAAVMTPAVVTVFQNQRAGLVSSAPSIRLQPLLGALLAPLGWLGYVAWVGYRTGSPTGYFAVEAGWHNGFDGGVTFARRIGELLASPKFFLGLLVCIAVASVVWLLLLGIRQRQPLPLLVYSGTSLVLALSTAGFFDSKPRYLLPAFPLLLPVAAWLARHHLRLRVSCLAVLAAASTVYGSYWLLNTRPP